MPRLPTTLVYVCLMGWRAPAQDTVAIEVDAARKMGLVRPVLNYFGYDEPNYTYTAKGRKLVGELAAASASVTYFRTHHLLTNGDAVAAFKWGSTNAYTEDGEGRPVYDWTVSDRIFETYLQAGGKPFVEIGFMPKALSSKPEPYVPVWNPGDKFDQYYVGWSYPPRDWDKWAELVFQWITHCVAKYGAREAASWYWEVWNEPDISYWHGTPEEYDRLFDVTAAAVKRALPAARIGGPASTGPGNPKAAAFLTHFLQHCADAGTPLDFITFHAKGSPRVVDGKVRMGLASEMKDVSRGFDIVRSFPKFAHLPIVLSEADPEGCAACSAQVYPQNAYRNGTVYASYTAAALKGILQRAVRAEVNLEGILTWAFEFEAQPYFAGFRTLASNGLDKPVLNLFRMAGLMRGHFVEAVSNGAPQVDALATATEHGAAILVWNYQDENVPGPAAAVSLHVKGLSPAGGRVLVKHYRIDDSHSNAFSAWQKAGSPQSPSPELYGQLEQAGQLQLLDSPVYVSARGSALPIRFSLPVHGVSLLELTWK